MILIAPKKRRNRTVKQTTIREGELEICQFTGKDIRRILHNDEWFFSIVDVISAVTDTINPGRYWFDLKVKLKTEGAYELSDKIVKLKMEGGDGKKYPTDSVNTETLFRIVQSVSSPRAEPFKQWLAKVGFERIQEHQNPSIAIKRAIVEYQLRGRPMDWIEMRLRTLFSRKEITEEWKSRGIIEAKEFAILTDEISLGTFGKTTAEHKEFKGLPKRGQGLRDNMTSVELILTMLGETSTKQIAQARDAQGFTANRNAAKAGGEVAGGARKHLEIQTGRKVISSSNNLEAAPPSKDLLTFPENLEEQVSQVYKKPKPDFDELF